MLLKRGGLKKPKGRFTCVTVRQRPPFQTVRSEDGSLGPHLHDLDPLPLKRIELPAIGLVASDIGG